MTFAIALTLVEAATRHGDSERELGFFTARVDALVTEDTFVVVPDVQVVLDLDGLIEPLSTIGVAGDVDAVLGRPFVDLGCFAQVVGRAEEFEHHLAAVFDPVGVGRDDHPLFGGS